jgi:hypothetical protein
MVIITTLDNYSEVPALTDISLSNRPEIDNYLGLFLGTEYGKVVGDLITENIKHARVLKKIDATSAVKALFDDMR